MTHLVSTVEGRLRPGVGLAEILHATFPGGSITGAPKLAAIDQIARFEPVGRGASMGAIGRVRANGDFELALTIRTFAIADGWIHLWVGGGIVWDSDPEAEIEESWVKARPAARRGRRPRAGMTAARRRDRGPRPRRSGRAGLPRRRRRAAARRRRVRDDPRLRRPAVPARRAPDALPLFRRRRSHCRRPTASRSSSTLVSAPRRPTTCCGSTGTSQTVVATAAPLPAGLDDLRARGVTPEDLRRRAAHLAARRREDDELRRLVRSPPRGGAGRRRRRAARVRRPRARGRDGERVVAARRVAVHAGRAARRAAGRHARVRALGRPRARRRVRRRRPARAPTRRS